MKRLLLTCVIALFSVVATYAQVAQEVVIRLKNGNEVRGILVERTTEGEVTIRSAEGDIFVYGQKDYSRIHEVEDPQAKTQLKKELEQQKLTEKERAKQLSLQKKNEKREMLEERALGKFKGYRGIAEVSGGTFRDGVFNVQLSYINGYNFGSCFYAGIGIGVACLAGYGDYHHNNSCRYVHDEPSINLPIFAHLRCSFARLRKVSPYFSMNLGYSVGLNSVTLREYDLRENTVCNEWTFHRSGLFCEPSLGIEIRIAREKAVAVAFSFPQHIQCFPKAGHHRHAINSICGFGLKVGFSF